MMAVTRWTRTPPRDNLRVIFTAADALRDLGVSDVGSRMAYVRSWATGTLLVRPGGFEPEEIRRLEEFCESRFFDLDWPVSVERSRSDFNRIARPVFREALGVAAGSEDSIRAFQGSYPFRIESSTDDRPYFGRFLRLRSTPSFVFGDRGELVPFAEWGYLGVVATFVQSGILALLLIGLPVLVLSLSRAPARYPVLRPAVYFGGIGFGFILVEMAFIQRLSLVLGNPVYAATVTLGALLVFSGLGSELSDRRPTRVAPVACLIVAGLSLLFGLGLSVTGLLSSLPLALRAAVAFVGVGGLGVAMGFPFPIGLRRFSQAEGGVPWAWAVNGVASVLGASLAILLAMEVGAKIVILLGALCYLAAAGVARNPSERDSP
jgi:hypothetical protein